jgi:hypothetical protein
MALRFFPPVERRPARAREAYHGAERRHGLCFHPGREEGAMDWIQLVPLLLLLLALPGPGSLRRATK